MGALERRGRLRNVAILLLVPVGLTLVMVATIGFRSPSKREIIESIKVGMSRSEIEGKLGVPPGDYTTKPIIPLPLGSNFARFQEWAFDEGLLMVLFDEDNRATIVRVIDNHPHEKVIMERIHDWIVR